MTVTLLLNIFFALGIVVALAVVCRIPYRLVNVERLEERAAPVTTAAPADRQRRAAQTPIVARLGQARAAPTAASSNFRTFYM